VTILGKKPLRILIIGNNEFARSIISSQRNRNYTEYETIDRENLDFSDLEKIVSEKDIQEIIVAGKISDDELLKLVP